MPIMSRTDRKIITNEIERMLRDLVSDRQRVPALLFGAEVKRVDNGHIQIRLPAAPRSGPRYFTIKISEQL